MRKLRKGTTLFMNVSSMVNIDVLTMDYALRLYNGALERHEFMKSVLGCRPALRRDARFYIRFGDEHKYFDGTRSGEAAYNWSELIHLDQSLPLQGGMDFGKMMSLVIGQEQERGKLLRIVKNLYILPPEWIPELAAAFLDFFKDYPVKELLLWYDRSGNNYEKQGEDHARKVKEAIEKYKDGRRTGWKVVLMSRKQAVIHQHEEFDFMSDLMRGETRGLPRLLIDALNCQELICSIEIARAGIRYKGQQKIIYKVKKSEKLEAKKLPRHSTNFSDAFKYFCMRRSWMNAAKPQDTGGAPIDFSMVDSWLANRGKK